MTTAASDASPPALTYAAALAAIAERGRFGINLGLGRTRALLRELGNPERTLRGALMAGTNGKGSVLALAGSALRAAGHRVGATPKPHLISYRERIQVDGRPIEAADFARLVGEVLPAAERIAARHGPPTEFELLTAVVFRWFAEQQLDVALVEVGLGGRLDATHSWDGGVAAITNVDLDHMAQLGSTVAAIAREKAAIIERGDLAVSGAGGEARLIVRRRARRLGVALVEVEPAPVVRIERDGIVVRLPRLGETRIGLRGRHQAANVAVADAILDALGAAGIADTPPEARRAGYAAVRWPGRLELLEARRPGGGSVEVLLDGAHNPAGAASLAEALDDLRPFLAGGESAEPPPLTLLTATMADKDVAGIVDAIDAAAAVRSARIICTRVPGPRALPSAALAARWSGRAGHEVEAIDDLDAALDRAMATADGTLVVAGSLYLVGAVRAKLVDDPALRDPDQAGSP